MRLREFELKLLYLFTNAEDQSGFPHDLETFDVKFAVLRDGARMKAVADRLEGLKLITTKVELPARGLSASDCQLSDFCWFNFGFDKLKRAWPSVDRC